MITIWNTIWVWDTRYFFTYNKRTSARHTPNNFHLQFDNRVSFTCALPSHRIVEIKKSPLRTKKVDSKCRNSIYAEKVCNSSLAHLFLVKKASIFVSVGYIVSIQIIPPTPFRLSAGCINQVSERSIKIKTVKSHAWLQKLKRPLLNYDVILPETVVQSQITSPTMLLKCGS